MLASIRSFFAALIIFVACVAPAQAQDFAGRYLQCAPFAREISGIQLFGNAAAWWDQAQGQYERGNTPRAGSVLSFQATNQMRAGHVAMVSEVVSDRVIKVTHANWSIINGSRGQIERNVEVIDVSPSNDWSQVRVWYAPIGKVGIKAYPTNGFIYNTAPRVILASAA